MLTYGLWEVFFFRTQYTSINFRLWKVSMLRSVATIVFNKLHSTADSAILVVSPLVALMKDQVRLLLLCTACILFHRMPTCAIHSNNQVMYSRQTCNIVT